MLNRVMFFSGAFLALAACGDDSAGTGSGGAGSGSGGGSTTATSSSQGSTTASTGQGGGAGVTTGSGGEGPGSGGGTTGSGGASGDFEQACADLCDGVRTAAEDLGCGEVVDCEVDICDEESSACSPEQLEVYACLATELSDGSPDGCFCEQDGEIECEGICIEESEALDACEAPIQEACLELDDAFLDCNNAEIYGDCIDAGDEAVGAGCGDAFYAVIDCIVEDAAACACTETDLECDGICTTETDALEACVLG